MGKQQRATASAIAPGRAGSDTLGLGGVAAQAIAPGAIGRQNVAPANLVAQAIAPASAGVQALAPFTLASQAVAPGSVGVQFIAPGAIGLQILAPGSVGVQAIAPLGVGIQIAAPGTIRVQNAAPFALRLALNAPGVLRAGFVAPNGFNREVGKTANGLAAMRTVTSVQMRELEVTANARGLGYDEMMRRAGGGAARLVSRVYAEFGKRKQQVLVLIGPGNNGGDGFVCAGDLAEELGNARVSVYVWKRKVATAESKDWPQHEVVELGVPIYPAASDADGEVLGKLLGQAIIVVDALLGTGQHGPFAPELEAILAAVRAEQDRREELYVVAIDVPTGIDADSGDCITANHIRATATATFAYAKPGLVQGDGKAAAGYIQTMDIGFASVGVAASEM